MISRIFLDTRGNKEYGRYLLIDSWSGSPLKRMIFFNGYFGFNYGYYIMVNLAVITAVASSVAPALIMASQISFAATTIIIPTACSTITAFSC